MAYVAFDGELDPPEAGTFVPFTGELDAAPNVVAFDGELDPTAPPMTTARRGSTMGALRKYDEAVIHGADVARNAQTAGMDPRDLRAERAARVRPQVTREENLIDSTTGERRPEMVEVTETGAPDPSIRLNKTDIPARTAGSVAQDVASSTLNILPTALKGGADIARLLTGDTVGADTSKFIGEHKAALSERGRLQAAKFSQDMVDNQVSVWAALSENPGALADMGIETIGSMVLPIGAAAGAIKVAGGIKGWQALPAAERAARLSAVATKTGIGTVVLQNASETFTQLRDDPDLQVGLADAYKGAGVSGAVALVAGVMTRGGLEGIVARKMAGKTGVGGLAGRVAHGGTVEWLQEGAESAGNYMGEQIGKGQPIDLTSPAALKQMAVGATLGLALGSAGGAMAGGRAPVPGSAQSKPEINAANIAPINDSGDVVAAPVSDVAGLADVGLAETRTAASATTSDEAANLPITPVAYQDGPNQGAFAPRPAAPMVPSETLVPVTQGVPDAAPIATQEAINEDRAPEMRENVVPESGTNVPNVGTSNEGAADAAGDFAGDEAPYLRPDPRSLEAMREDVRKMRDKIVGTNADGQPVIDTAPYLRTPDGKFSAPPVESIQQEQGDVPAADSGTVVPNGRSTGSESGEPGRGSGPTGASGSGAAQSAAATINGADAAAPADGVAAVSPVPPADGADQALTFKEQFVARKAKREALSKRVTELFERDNIVEARRTTDDSYRIALTKEVRPGGTEFRVTSFDNNEPTGHREYNTIDDALTEFSSGNMEIVESAQVLENPTPDALKEREQSKIAAEKERMAAKAKADREEATERAAKETQQQADKTVDDFALGQDADQQLEGKGLFDGASAESAVDAEVLPGLDLEALAGRDIEIDVEVTDGTTSKLRMDAAAAVRDIRARLKAARQLQGCL